MTAVLLCTYIDKDFKLVLGNVALYFYTRS